RDDQEFKKRVAIKILKRGMDTEEILRRFRNERQTLAALDHPYIARLYDGGTTEDGLPYFVMEYIDGQPIDLYCDSHRLNTTERLQLFCKVCLAVHFAHQNLIIHRDLKPGNILVTEQGDPKLLDFGIAKLINPELTAQSIKLTRERMQLMTPQYASPEQVRGDPITTASDVYSLGVLLYELLTGHAPYRFKSSSPHEIERVICEQEPEKPSVAITRVEEVQNLDGSTTTLTPEIVSRIREGQPEKLKRRLVGDLDNIILMALRKESQRRYNSAQALAEDIRRHLMNLPVEARHSTLKYRSFKFIKRHKFGMIAASLILIILLAGIVSTARQAKIAKENQIRAEQHFNNIRKLANTLIFEIYDTIKDLPGSTSARKLLVQRALKYLSSLAKEAKDDPSLQLELAWAYQKIGDVQGNPNNANLGDLSGAIESYHKGITLTEEVIANHPGDSLAMRAQAVFYEKLSDVQSWSGDLTSAIKSNKQSLQIYQRLATSQPAELKYQQLVAISHIKLGDILGNPNFPNTGDAVTAKSHYQKAWSILRKLHASDSTDIVTHRYLGLIYERLGTIFEVTSQISKAFEFYQNSLNIRKNLSEQKPFHYDIQRDLAVAYEKMANMYKAFKEPTQALLNYQKSTAIFERLYKNDIKNTNAQRSVCFSYEHMGDILEILGRFREAMNYYQKSLKLRENLAMNDPSNLKDRADLGWNLYKLATLCYKNDQLNSARKYSKQMMRVQKSLVDRPGARAIDYNNFAWYLLTCEPPSLRNPEMALSYAKKAVEMSHKSDPNFLDTLALAYFQTGQTERAIQLEKKAVSLLISDSPLRKELEKNLAKFKAAQSE
ncbi:MAG: serine/threonine-protein kinase, partial [Calditrichaeota bacterium]